MYWRLRVRSHGGASRPRRRLRSRVLQVWRVAERLAPGRRQARARRRRRRPPAARSQRNRQGRFRLDRGPGCRHPRRRRKRPEGNQTSVTSYRRHDILAWAGRAGDLRLLVLVELLAFEADPFALMVVVGAERGGHHRHAAARADRWAAVVIHAAYSLCSSASGSYSWRARLSIASHGASG